MFVVAIVVIVLMLVCAFKESSVTATYKANKVYGRLKAYLALDFVAVGIVGILSWFIPQLKDAGFPAVVVENTPKYLRRSKVPVVKAKIGPQIMSLMCDAQAYPLIPVGGKPIKAVLSGIYITSVKGIRGSLEKPEPKKKFLDRFKKEKK